MVYFETWKKYAVFDGRANREEFFTFFFGNILIAFVLGIVGPVMHLRFVVVLFILFTLGLFIPLIAVTVRRLHDTGKSGWWYFIGFVPFIGGIILLVILCMRGDDGANAYDGGNSFQAVSEPVVIASSTIANGADIGLVNFIKQSRSTGKTDSEIHQVLAGSGWAETDIQLGMDATKDNQGAVVILNQEKKVVDRKFVGILLGCLVLGVFVVGGFIFYVERVKKEVPSNVTTTVEELSRVTKPAGKDDIEGKWDVFYAHRGKGVPYDDTPMYQRFDFLSDGYVKQIASSKPLDEMSSVILEKSPKTIRYEFRKPGVLFLKRVDGDQYILTAVVTEDLLHPLSTDAPKLKKNDLIFSYVTSENKPYLLLYLRRMNVE